MIARIQTELPSSADKVWQALLKRDTFLYITRGMLGFVGSEGWPDTFQEGVEIETRLLLLGWIPGWRHKLRVVRVDEDAMALESREGGGIVRRWDHRIWLGAGTGKCCTYTDEIEIEAGVWTILVWAYAHMFYRYRQRRWRRLARDL